MKRLALGIIIGTIGVYAAGGYSSMNHIMGNQEKLSDLKLRNERKIQMAEYDEFHSKVDFKAGEYKATAEEEHNERVHKERLNNYIFPEYFKEKEEK